MAIDDLLRKAEAFNDIRHGECESLTAAIEWVTKERKRLIEAAAKFVTFKDMQSFREYALQIGAYVQSVDSLQMNAIESLISHSKEIIALSEIVAGIIQLYETEIEPKK